MKDNNVQTIPYYVHEGEMVRMERYNRRVSALCAVIGAMIPVAWSLGRMARK